MSISLEFMLKELSRHALRDIWQLSIEIFRLSSSILYAKNLAIIYPADNSHGVLSTYCNAGIIIVIMVEW